MVAGKGERGFRLFHVGWGECMLRNGFVICVDRYVCYVLILIK